MLTFDLSSVIARCDGGSLFNTTLLQAPTECLRVAVCSRQYIFWLYYERGQSASVMRKVACELALACTSHVVFCTTYFLLSFLRTFNFVLLSFLFI